MREAATIPPFQRVHKIRPLSSHYEKGSAFGLCSGAEALTREWFDPQ